MFHVGGARSALQNWIYAKQHNGVFILRIEDTDTARNRPEWTEGILEALDWIGIKRGTYEGPLFQSSYAAEQGKAIQHLIDAKRAYHCTCTREEVIERTGNKHTGYDGFCRDRGLTSGALRFRTADEGTTTVVDVIRGTPTWENRLIEDFVIARGDGSPVFLLANVADDITMGITHVIRAEEHLPNTPKQQMLWEALGHTPPVWAHVPVVVNEKRQKLSKRRDKVALEMYRDEGYLADAMRNYLMLLGWSPSGDREIVPWSVIEEEYRLENVNPSPAFFDEKKLRAFNGEYIRAMPVGDFIVACEPWLAAVAGYDRDVFARVAPLAQTRIAVLSEIVPNVDFLFLDEAPLDPDAWEKAKKDAAILPAVIEAFEALPAWDAATLKDALVAVGEAHDLKLGKAQAPVRVAVTGRSVGLPLFESLEVLGRSKTLQRLSALVPSA
jgi:glutamyl-tRNA synthetase